MRNFLEQSEDFEDLVSQHRSPPSYVSEPFSDCIVDSMDSPYLIESQPHPFWHLSESTDEGSDVLPLRPWPTNFPGSTSEMTMCMSAHAIGTSSTIAPHPISATAPDESWLTFGPMSYLTMALEGTFDQPGQGQDPTRKCETPSDDGEEQEGEEGEEEEEEDAELDDDDSGLYKEHHAEIVGRERSDSATRRLIGNNPYGSRGCESCMACRRRKGKCVYTNKEDSCAFCAKMNHHCGPKVTKTEFQTIQNGRPCPQIRLSEIAKELERDFPMRDARDLYVMLGERLEEIEQKRKQLQNDPSLSLISRASSPPRGDKVIRGKREKRKRIV